MEIKINLDEFESVVDKVDYLLDNCDYVQNCILSTINALESEKLFGISNKIHERMTELDNYNNHELASKITEIRDELDELKHNFIDQDDYNKNDINR